MKRIRSFSKEVKRVRKAGSRIEETLKDGKGRLLNGEEVRKRWAEFFDSLLNIKDNRETGVEVPVMGDKNERDITCEEVRRALDETRVGKESGIDSVSAELLMEGGVTVLEWL
ncbi:uncharacterized protein, partial [Palaemon carinicauda]|uniref:uncharacterized protein n=1 Tax=Palaemon carinicauda TaxID=392227 RepID=UPI0035B5C1DD